MLTSHNAKVTSNNTDHATQKWPRNNTQHDDVTRNKHHHWQHPYASTLTPSPPTTPQHVDWRHTTRNSPPNNTQQAAERRHTMQKATANNTRSMLTVTRCKRNHQWHLAGRGHTTQKKSPSTITQNADVTRGKSDHQQHPARLTSHERWKWPSTTPSLHADVTATIKK